MLSITERHVALSGASNFRDFGGYRAPDGRVVVGQLFRSDRLSRLSAEDFQRLESLGLRLIVDLRRSSERQGEPTVWQGSAPPEDLHAPVFEDDNTPTSLLQISADPQTRNAEAAADMMREVYRRLVSEPLPLAHFGQVLQRLSAAEATPMVVHCSGGKDRTGVLVALLLSALGVSWDDVLEDFMLTDQLYDGRQLLAERSSQILETHGVEMDEDALAPVFGVHPSYLDAARQEAEVRYGGFGALLEVMGIDGTVRERLRARYLEPTS